MGGPTRLLLVIISCAAVAEAYYSRQQSQPSESHSYSSNSNGDAIYYPEESESSQTMTRSGGGGSYRKSWSSSSSHSSGGSYSGGSSGSMSNSEASSKFASHESQASSMTFKGGCKGTPVPPPNVNMRCSSKSGCQVSCAPDHRFPNGATQLVLTCADGTWQVEGAEWEVLPACEPVCSPACTHGGRCVAPGRCHCLQNFSGPQCQFENKPCRGFPPLTKNSQRSCTSSECTVSCAPKHEFPDGTTTMKIVCKEGSWQPLRTDLVTVPDCRAICKPPCKNGGNCLSHNICQCTQEYRGPQCQYSADACSAKKLKFNGSYNCSGVGDTFSCSIRCPAGIKFDFPPAPVYTCDYASGTFQPTNIPQCIFGPNMKITNMSATSHTTFYNSSNSNSWSTHGGSQQGSFVEFDTDEEDNEEWIEIITKTRYRKKNGNKYKYQNEFYNESNYGEGSVHGEYGVNEAGNVQYQIIQPRPAVCFTWAGTHYKTFDEHVYSFVSDCAYTLARDSVDNTFNIITKNSPSCFKGDSKHCHKIIRIFLNNLEYSLSASEIDGQPILANSVKTLPIPISLPGMKVELLAHFVKVTLDSVGVTLKWDGKQLVQLEATEALWNRTSGLCGRLDGDHTNDMMSKDGRSVHKSTSSFVENWRVSDLAVPDSCSGAEVDEEMQKLQMTCKAGDRKAAKKFCKRLLSNEKFSQCYEVQDVELLLNSCIFDYCNCKQKDPSVCACETLSIFTKECTFRGVSVPKGWRNQEMCPLQCSGGKIYKECGPSTHVSCGSVNTENIETLECEEGCFCPEGTLLHGDKCVEPDQCTCKLRGKEFQPGEHVKSDCNTCTCERGQWTCTEAICTSRCAASGDPHYTTFDGRRYDFMGTCSYYLVKAEDYSIEAENIACRGHLSKGEYQDFSAAESNKLPSCTKTVSIKMGGKIVQLKQNRVVTVDGIEVTHLPLNLTFGVIRSLSSSFIGVDLSNGLQVQWDGKTRVHIDAPPTLQGRTKGLCGTFNSNQEDDFLTPEGDVEQSIASFANKWKTSDHCEDIRLEPQNHPCDVNPQNKPIAERLCKKIKEDLFSKCHFYLDPETYYQNCLFDVCACEGANDDTGAGACLCPNLASYASECTRLGAQVDWRSEVPECNAQCPVGQVHQMCGDSCTYSCRDLQASLQQDEPRCKSKCSEGCMCTEGRYFDSASGECVTRMQCPCEHLGDNYNLGQQIVKIGQNGTRNLCTCTGAAWSCRKAKAMELNDCDSKPNHEFTNCEPVNEISCTNMHQQLEGISQNVNKVCKPGCKCKEGYVLETKSGHCIKPKECPCHHGGRSYEDGATMQEDCNTCTCSHGKWNCGKRKCSRTCSAWGDSHFDTFDGRAFDFQGACDYVLAKGSLALNDSFEVTIQNVPCGSSGETCSKSVTLKVGVESVTLEQHKPIPQLDSYQRISLRRISRIVFLDVPDLGLVLQWDRGTTVYVKLDVRWKGQTKGLCGDYNDNEADDFKSPSGGLESSPREFGDSWRLHDYCVKAQELQESCEKHPERKPWAQRKCGLLKSEPFARCHSEVPVERYLTRCLFDACACDLGGDCECLCTTLAAYAQKCAMRGIPIKWRTPELCPMQCDELCSEYSACVSPCPVETCDNSMMKMRENEVCEQDSCVEGCQLKPCPAGHVYLNSTGLECVPKSQCQPVCLEMGGVVYYEGDLISEDDCQSCYCSRNKKVCKGQPCTTKDLEKITACTSGWSSWMNHNAPKTTSETSAKGKPKKIINEEEPLPTFAKMVKTSGAGACPPGDIVNIECRTAKAPHKLANETGLNVKCSLDKGLICKGTPENPCIDFEIRVECHCEKVTTSLPLITMRPAIPHHTTQRPLDHTPCDPARPHEAHPSDCHLFYHCEPDASGGYWLIQKTCGSDMMYNPVAMVCDWPYSVKAIREYCDETSRQTPSTIETGEIEVAEDCPPGEVWSECAVPCERACTYYEYLLIQEGKCSPSQEYRNGCRAGCTTASRDLQCAPGQVWRDAHTCVEIHDCTCRSSSGKIVKPGEVVHESSCKICQCVDNHYTCDVRACEHQEIPRTTTIRTDSHLGIRNDSVINIIEENLEISTPYSVSDKDELIIVITTMTPPPNCHPDNLVGLIEKLALPESAFSASSTLSQSFAPSNCKLNSKVSTISGGSWSPAESTKGQYLQVTMPRPEPVYGIIVKGSPLYEKYVTSYKVMYSIDGVGFSYINKKRRPQIFKGCVDRNTPVKQIFDHPIEAKIIRIKPHTWHDDIALRLEILGCRQTIVTSTPSSHTLMPHFTTESTELMICDDPMGVQNGEIKFQQITVSSFFSTPCIPKINGTRYWKTLVNRPNEFIMFDFLEARNLTGVKTQGGPEGWVKSFIALYSHDKRNWLPVLGPDGKKKEFLANHDSDHVQTNAFSKTVRARYLKFVPTRWTKNIVMRIEPLGCFEPYPLVEEDVPLVTLPPNIPSECKPCPGLAVTSCLCTEPLHWDGKKCVKFAECPCVVGHILYAVGTEYETEDCTQCTCYLGGVSHCAPKICDPCPEGHRNIITSKCGCVCKPCEPNERLCPSANICIPKDSWCNGVKDCPDDETGCVEPTTKPTKPDVEEFQEMKCPVVECPPNYKVVYKTNTRTYYSSKDDSPIFNVDYGPSTKTYGGSKHVKGGNKGGRLAKPARLVQASTTEDDESKECPQFQCVPEVGKRPTEVEHTPKECPKVQCPKGYTVQKEESKIGKDSGCPKYTCYPPPKPDAMCNITGRTFNTFDGTEFKMDVCSHVIARDMQLDNWYITLEKNCSVPAPTCPLELIIVQDGETLRLLPDLQIMLDGYRYTVDQTQRIGFRRRAFLLSKVGDTLFFVSNKYGFWVIWEAQGNVKIGMSGKLTGSVDGLCGFFNHRADDDKQKPDGTPASSTAEFADSWATPSSTPALCEPSACPAKIQAKAFEICNSVRKEPLSVCSSVIDLDKWVSSCLETVCTCLRNNVSAVVNAKHEENKCRCQALQAFAVECQASNNNVDLQNWRAQEGCPCKSCPAPLVYRDCYRRRCEPSCESLRSGSRGGTTSLSTCPTLPGVCFPGCYCPDGMVRKGDECVLPTECRDCVCDGFGTTKYVTYDRTNFNFAGNCTYLLTRDKINGPGHAFQVYVTNGPCPESPKDVCTQALHVLHGPHKLIIKRGKVALQLEVSVDGKQISRFPYNTDWLRVNSIPGRDVTILIPGAQLELSAFYHNMAFMVRTPSRTYGGRLEGLCGDCDSDPENDFLSSDGSQSFDASTFASSWLMKNSLLGFSEEGCKDLQVVAEECHKPKPAEDLCIKLTDPEAFAQCNIVLDPLPYIQACREQMCSAKDREDKQRIACASLEAYDRECKRQGICAHWRKPDMCPYPECAPGLKYNSCGLGCEVTCSNSALATNPDMCKEDIAEGCFCPKGLVYHNNTCVDPRLCFPCDTEGHFAGDRWQVDNCKSCVCSEISQQVQCSVTVCPAPESLCSSDQRAVKLPSTEEQCCDNYTCVTEKKGTAPPVCPEPKVPTCGPDQKVNLDQDGDECPQYVCQCIPVETCPPLSNKEELKAGMEKKVIDNGCCPHVAYSCKKSLCPEAPECPEFYELVEKPLEEDECCPQYTCQPPKGKCLYESKYTGSVNGGETFKTDAEKNTYLKMPGEKWTDGPCRDCQCVEDAANRGSYDADCSVRQCPGLLDHPDLTDYELRLQPEPYQCCAAIRRHACLEGEDVHQIGESWSHGDACKTISCIRTKSGEAGKVEKVEKCKTDCPMGSRYEPSKLPAVTCCGTCIQQFCVLGEKVYAPGEVWLSTDKCTNYSCDNLGNGQLAVKIDKQLCPDVSHCKKDRIYRKGCCEYCNETSEALKTCSPHSLALPDTVGLVKYNKPSHGLCKNLQPIKGFTGCQGRCHSGTIFNSETFKHEKDCKCCVPSKYENLEITLTCEDGFTLNKNIDVPSDCDCNPCAEQEAGQIVKGSHRTTRSLHHDLVETFDPHDM